MKKLVLILLVLVVVGGSAFAFDIHSFPAPIEKGNLMITPMVGIGRYWWGGFALAIPVAIEYALPINFALSVGGETGVAFGFTGGDSFYGTAILVPIMAKVAWHPNFEVNKLDTYIALKMGVAISFLAGASEVVKGGVGFAWGFDLGVRYFFTPKFSISGELGYDYYMITIKEDWYGGTWKWRWPIGTFLRVGVTFKI